MRSLANGFFTPNRQTVTRHMASRHRIDGFLAADPGGDDSRPLGESELEFCPPLSPWELPEFDDEESLPEDGDFWIEPDGFDP